MNDFQSRWNDSSFKKNPEFFLQKIPITLEFWIPSHERSFPTLTCERSEIFFITFRLKYFQLANDIQEPYVFRCSGEFNWWNLMLRLLDQWISNSLSNECFYFFIGVTDSFSPTSRELLPFPFQTNSEFRQNFLFVSSGFDVIYTLCSKHTRDYHYERPFLRPFEIQLEWLAQTRTYT